jgi:cytochrome c peroxidase
MMPQPYSLALGCLAAAWSLTVPSSEAAEALGTPDPQTIEYPAGQPPSPLEIELGKTLYFDPRLSFNHSQSCATCHNPDLGFSDGMAKGLGAKGSHVGRNAPHIVNLAWGSIFFWDGRAATLEEQALGPIKADGEMNLPLDSVAPRLSKAAYYRRTFDKVYGKGGLQIDNVAKALAAFERSLIVRNTPYDRYLAGDKLAMSPNAVAGLEVFQKKGRCTECHSGPNFTDDSFHNIGVNDPDSGRARILAGPGMLGAYKTPGLRNVLYSAPYMHDGSEKSLEDVVRFYNRGGDKKEGLDKLIVPLNLTEQEIQNLVAFMGSINEPLVVQTPRIPPDDAKGQGSAR